jgi:hypothetical protein
MDKLEKNNRAYPLMSGPWRRLCLEGGATNYRVRYIIQVSADIKHSIPFFLHKMT